MKLLRLVGSGLLSLWTIGMAGFGAVCAVGVTLDRMGESPHITWPLSLAAGIVTACCVASWRVSAVEMADYPPSS